MKKRRVRTSPSRGKGSAKPPGSGEPVEVKAEPAALLTVRMVEDAIPYAEVTLHEPLTEDSMERIFTSSLRELLRLQAKRVLVDMRDASFALSISDMNGLVKLIATNLASQLERFAIVLRPVDMPAEKFVEPSLSNRGLPTCVTQDYDDAVGWVTAKLLRPH